MTKRLALVGIALVACVWGPYVYAELARKPLEAEELEAVPQPSPIATTPVAWNAAAETTEAHETAEAPSIDPDLEPTEPATGAALELELAAAEPAPEPEPAAVPAAEPTVAPEPPPSAATAAAAPEPPPAAAAVEPPPPAATPAEPEAVAEAPVQEAAAQEPAAAPSDGPSDLGEAAKAVREGNLNVIPEALAPALRTAFDSESRDVHWASRQERSLTSLLSSAGVPYGAISEVRCQRTVCRVAINPSDIESATQAELYKRVSRELGFNVALSPNNQEQRAAFYVLRKAQ